MQMSIAQRNSRLFRTPSITRAIRWLKNEMEHTDEGSCIKGSLFSIFVRTIVGFRRDDSDYCVAFRAFIIIPKYPRMAYRISEQQRDR